MFVVVSLLFTHFQHDIVCEDRGVHFSIYKVSCLSILQLLSYQTPQTYACPLIIHWPVVIFHEVYGLLNILSDLVKMY